MQKGRYVQHSQGGELSRQTYCKMPQVLKVTNKLFKTVCTLYCKNSYKHVQGLKGKIGHNE